MEAKSSGKWEAAKQLSSQAAKKRNNNLSTLQPDTGLFAYSPIRLLSDTVLSPYHPIALSPENNLTSNRRFLCL